MGAGCRRGPASRGVAARPWWPRWTSRRHYEPHTAVHYIPAAHLFPPLPTEGHHKLQHPATLGWAYPLLLHKGTGRFCSSISTRSRAQQLPQRSRKQRGWTPRCSRHQVTQLERRRALPFGFPWHVLVLRASSATSPGTACIAGVKEPAGWMRPPPVYREEVRNAPWCSC